MRVLSLQSLMLLSLLGHSIFVLGDKGSRFSPLVPSDFGQALPPSKITLNFLIEEELYQNLPNLQVLHQISIFLKGLPPQNPSLVSCKNLDLESFENPIYILIDNQQSELFVAYYCKETYIKAIITVNENLVRQIDASEATVDYDVYIGSVCSYGSYNLIKGECTSLVRKRGLDLTQDQQELHDYYEQVKSNGVAGAIGVCYDRDEMYKELFDEMVSDLYLFVTQWNFPDFDWTDSVSAVISLLSLNFANDTQADTLYNLEKTFKLLLTGKIENFLDMSNSYLHHYRKHDKSVNHIFLKRLEDIATQITTNLYVINRICEIGWSLSFSSYTEGSSRISLSLRYFKLGYWDLICNYRLECPIYLTLTFEHISQFSQLSIGYFRNYNVYSSGLNCPEFINPISVALYSESLNWNCFGSKGICAGLSIQNSIATFTPTYHGIYLLYPSTCLGNTVMDPNSNLCCFENCLSCKTQTTCSTCKQGYVPTANKTQCGCNDLLNCSICSDNLDSCEVCEASYTLQSDGACYPKCGSIIGCTSCSDDFSVCFRCDEGYYLKNLVCITCDSYSSACSSCGDSNIDYGSYGESNLFCSKCKPHNALSGNQCTYCNGTNNCVNCDLTGYTCSRCELGYFLFDNICNKCSNSLANCTECGTYGEFCTKCDNMYAIQVNKTCLKCNGITNCETCDSAGLVCSTCVSGMYVKDNVCVYCKNDYINCTECSIASGCTACIAPLRCIKWRMCAWISISQSRSRFIYI